MKTALIALCALFLTAACVTERPPRRGAATCAGCEKTRVFDDVRPFDDGDYSELRGSAQGMQCASCRSALTNLLSGAGFEHSCTICGAGVNVCAHG